MRGVLEAVDGVGRRRAAGQIPLTPASAWWAVAMVGWGGAGAVTSTVLRAEARGGDAGSAEGEAGGQDQ